MAFTMDVTTQSVVTRPLKRRVARRRNRKGNWEKRKNHPVDLCNTRPQ